MRKKIAVAGEILVEIMAEKRNQEFLDAGKWLGPYASGAPAIFINQACKLGGKGLILGAVGDDDFGQLCINHLKNNNVSTNGIKISKKNSTGVAFVKYDGKGDRKFIYHIDNAASGDIELEDIKESYFQDIGYFHIMGSSIFNKKMLDIHNYILAIVPKNTVISLDPNIRVEILSKSPILTTFILSILKKSNILISTESELEFLAQKKKTKQSIDSVWQEHPLLQYIIIKQGSAGAVLYTRDRKPYFAKPLEVTEIDPTGAGDSFAGAFIAALSMNYNHFQALEIANLAGAHAVTKQGPMEGTIDLKVVNRYHKI